MTIVNKLHGQVLEGETSLFAVRTASCVFVPDHANEVFSNYSHCQNAQNQVLYSEELRNRSVNNAEKLTSDFYAFPISGMPHKKSYTHAAQSIHIREIA